MPKPRYVHIKFDREQGVGVPPHIWYIYTDFLMCLHKCSKLQELRIDGDHEWLAEDFYQEL